MNRLLTFFVGVATGAAILTCVRLLGVEETSRSSAGRAPPPNEPSGFATPPRDEEPPPRPVQAITGVVPAREAPRPPLRRPGVKRRSSPAAITGSVRKLDGTPAEGVVVRATATPENKSSKWDLYRRVTARLPTEHGRADRGVPEGRGGRAAARREAISDAAGKYALTELGTGPYYLRARLLATTWNRRSRRRRSGPAPSSTSWRAPS